MRSEEITTMSKSFMDKVKRKRINWVRVLLLHQDPQLERQFICRLSVLHRGKSFSTRRCAYYTLKNYYHTTTIDELKEKCDSFIV